MQEIPSHQQNFTRQAHRLFAALSEDVFKKICANTLFKISHANGLHETYRALAATGCYHEPT
jgi:hypothetical protein